MEQLTQFANLGAVAILGLYAISQFFSWLKSYRNGTNGDQLKQQAKEDKDENNIDIAVLRERMRNLESNHLVHQVQIVDYMKEDKIWKKEHEAEHSEFKQTLRDIANKMGV